MAKKGSQAYRRALQTAYFRSESAQMGPSLGSDAGLSYLDRGEACTFEESLARVRDPKRAVFKPTNPGKRSLLDDT